MTRLRHVRHPRDEEDAQHLRTLAGVMMQHHVGASWWNVRVKVATYIGARSYARRSLEETGVSKP
jgi:hypothetical protein